MSSRPADASGRLTAAEVGRFTALVAILAIFSDAAIGHGLSWENDPYWTYWITKTFLIATIFGLGTAWFGIGIGRGAVITAVHTLVLTIYYWTLSPIGLPSSPEWLDLEHTWLTGLPIHFGVIYLGYLMALWLWRRRAAEPEDRGSTADGAAALLTAVGVVVVSGGVTSVLLGSFPGLTWFVVRLLLTVPFVLWWWAWAGRDRTSAIAGGITLAFVWATYSQFLGPVGLPDTPLRLLDTAPPPATAEWLDYRQVWMVSFPAYLVTMVGILLVAARGVRRSLGTSAATVALLGLLPVLGAASEQDLGQEGTLASISASGPLQVETGPYYSDAFAPGTGDISVQAEDMGARVTPLPPHDRLELTAAVATRGGEIEVSVQRAMIQHPLAEHTTWWGVGLGVEHHGDSGIGTGALPPIDSDLAAFGLGDVTVDGRLVATGVPVHVMTAGAGLPGGASLELDVGMEGLDVPGLPAGHLRALWPDHRATIDDPHPIRYAIGAVVLLVLLGAMLALTRKPLG